MRTVDVHRSVWLGSKLLEVILCICKLLFILSNCIRDVVFRNATLMVFGAPTLRPSSLHDCLLGISSKFLSRTMLT
jgi:hypothetical protein